MAAMAAMYKTLSLFAGGGAHTDERTEATYNLQSPTLFIDIRIPHRRGVHFGGGGGGGGGDVASLSDEQLRLLARQHAFGGYTLAALGEPINSTCKNLPSWNLQQSHFKLRV